jgi:Raf kinase inhibitor-like YbhB/YbcL family protein
VADFIGKGELMADILLRSAAFEDHDLMPHKLSRQGGNMSPPLEWSQPPSGTTELVLLCEDPDAGRTPFLHWLVTGIDPNSSGVAEDHIPPRGRQWRNDFGGTGWDGPQPPVGDDPHRYFFHLYAVDEPLELPEHPSVYDVQAAAEAHELASGTIVGRFGR